MKKTYFKRLFVLFILCCTYTLCYSTIAYPNLVDFKQPNGNIVKVIMRGSETLKWAETEDGYTLMYDSVGNLVYAELDASGDLVPTSMIATEKDIRPAEVVQRLQATPKKLNYSQRQINMVEQIQSARNSQMAASANSGAPVVGTKKMLLILVEFPDCPFKKSKRDFELLMNQLNYTDDGRYGSVRDFYLENSFGQLDLITDVVGVYRLNYDRAYYGGNNGYSNDNDPRQMALEAIAMADAEVDFSKYDNDGDGTVDGVHIIYAGPGEEAGGGGDCIWAHSWTASKVVDGVRTSRYSCSPEIRGSGGNNITHIGVICHEIGHVLGAMDFYDTNYGTGGQYPGTGNWDLMASGNWNGDGACPAHFNPYSKIYDYGWTTVEDGNKAASFTLGAKQKGSFVRIDTQTDGEFFLLEYRAKSGFDTCIPHHGLMIYRASDGLSRMGANTLNAYHKQQFYPLVANATSEIPTSIASTYGSVNISTAPFPGTLGVDEITDFTTPSMKSWIGVNTEFPITSIKEDVSNESVTFNVAGGAEGEAYGFKVTDSDATSISLGWNTPANNKVLLAYNTEATFGVPENRNYSVGETINGGGKVVYVGDGTTFKHDGLEQQEEYYYKLFTLYADGTYTTGRQLKAKTAGVIRKFPYTEDFSSMVLPANWKSELIMGEEPWKVEQLYETGNWMLIYGGSFISHRRTRVIMPVIDFTNATCAALSFDYRNFLQILEVAYRTSPTDEWHLLESFEAKEATYDNYTINGEQHVDYKLPNLSSNYEIAFTVDYVSVGNSISSAERATIDNIKIQTDFDAFVSTLRPNFISSTIAKIETSALEGTDKITEKGIQWSTDKTSWTAVKAEADGIATLSSLPEGCTIYYRGYAKTVSGKTLYGETLSLTTLTFTAGNGTKEDPYLIGSNADWTLLRNFVNAGNECENIHFAINKSFTLTNSTKISKTFNGVIDGRDNTVTITSQKINSLFDVIGPKGKLMNISIHIDKINSGENLNSGVYCSKNLGQISNCKTYIGELNSSGYCFGICRSNEGTIYNCESEIYGIGEALNAAGICGWNHTGTIIGCSFKGKLSANNNSYIAGIAMCNYTGKKNRKEACGLISDCVNYGTMEIYLNGGKAWWVGAAGICCTNYGWIQRCVNKGTIIANNGDNSVSSGGIVSSNDVGTIVDCYNIGEITTSNNSTSAQAVGVGGVAGSGYLSSIRNAFSLKNIKVNGVRTNYINGVIGSNNQAEIENCYYWGEDTDGYATQCEYSELCSQDMLHKLNNNGENDVWTLMDGRPALKWEKTGVMMTQDLIFGMDATSVDLSWIVLGKNVVSSGLEWRKRGTLKWKRESGACNQPSSVELSGLEPATIYETRVYAITTSGETLTTPIETFATLFGSDGTKNDPHLITNYNQLLAFNEMIAHGVELGQEIVRLTCDLDLKGEQGILWNPIKSKYGKNGFEGEFDGNGHVLSHMYIDTKKCYAGLFGLFRGYVHDLSIVDSDIKCNTAPSTNSYYAGVGGIVGSSIWYSAEYPHIVQRCGFEGRITGGNAIGGIIGAVATIDAVNDCYTNADITYTQKITRYSSQTGVGGIVGDGNALNSYAAGSITINHTFGVSYGPIAGRYYNASSPNVNSYYDIVCNKSYSNSDADIKTATGTMQSDAFLNSLTADVWTRANHINEGYPIFASRAASRVTTGEAKYTESGDIEINGIYTMGVDKEYNTFGFQWYSKMGDKQNVVETIVENNSKNYFSLAIPNHIVTNEGINYRAFAAQDNDTILGEWTIFIPNTSEYFYINYIVDGEIYATDSLAYGSKITLIDEPEKEGYTFSGWSEAPATMPAEDITISGTFSINYYNVSYTGGANGTVKLSASTVPYGDSVSIELEPNSNYTIGYLAVNGRDVTTEIIDGRYTVYNVKSDVKFNVTFAPLLTNNSMDVGTLTTSPGGTLVIPVEMNNENEITGLQFDVYLPNGITVSTDDEDEPIIAIAGDRKTSSHVVASSQLSDGGMRIAVYSNSNKPFRGNKGTLLNITTKVSSTMALGDYTLTLKNIRLADVDENEYVTKEKSSKISVTFVRGDANMDDVVSISDVVAVVNHILEKSTKVFNFMAADVTGDNNVSIVDVVGIVNIILNPNTEYSVGRNGKRGAVAHSSDRLTMADARNEAGSVAIPVSLNNSTAYTAFQMDVELPEGATFASATLGSRAASSHSISWQTMADNKVRVVAYSLKNATFAGNDGELLTLNVEAAEGANGTVTVDNVHMATADGVENAIKGCGSIIDINGTTGIGSIDGNMFKVYMADGALVVESGKAMQLPVYSLNGRLLKVLDVAAGKNTFEALPAGVYVVNGVKVVIK